MMLQLTMTNDLKEQAKVEFSEQSIFELPGPDLRNRLRSRLRSGRCGEYYILGKAG